MLTPLDIESKSFRKSLSGYSTSEVRQFMKEVLANYEKIYKENIELKDKINLLNEGIQYYKTIEETLQNTLLLAEKTAEDTKINARTKAEQIEKEAELKAEVIINEAKNEVYRISQIKEQMISSYDASKIQIKQFLKAQLELTQKNDFELRNQQTTLDILLKDNSTAGHIIKKDNEIKNQYEQFDSSENSTQNNDESFE
jgi:cell division initiation protein